MKNRREFIKKTAGLLAAPTLLSTAATRENPAKLRRRIIYNNDGDDLFLTASGGAPDSSYPARFDSVDQFLSVRNKELVGTDVTTLLYCGYVEEPDWEFPRKNIAALGPNPVKPVVDFAHTHRMEFFYTIRMNDIHTTYAPELWPEFKRKNAHLLLANVTREEFDKDYLPWALKQTDVHPLHAVLKRIGSASREYRSWAAYDYSRPEVRARFLGLIEGVCERYDIDGIELDWRHAIFFKFGDEARQAPVLTDFIRLVRQRLDQYGKRRGRPILLGMKVADTPGLSLNIGVDIETWMSEGLVDWVAAGYGYMPSSYPLADWVKTAHRYGVASYGVVERAVLPAESELFRDAMQAVAYRYWQAGVDGLYFFNLFFDPGDTDCLKGVGDPQRLARQNKLYQMDRNWRDMGPMNLTSLPGQLPCLITNAAGAHKVDLQLEIADDPRTAKQVTVWIRLLRDEHAGRVTFELNGKPLGAGQRKPATREHHYPYAGGAALRPGELDPSKLPKPGWLAFETSALKQGTNQLRVRMRTPKSGSMDEPVEVGQVRVAIRYT